jgi:hypothetical protein
MKTPLASTAIVARLRPRRRDVLRTPSSGRVSAPVPCATATQQIAAEKNPRDQRNEAEDEEKDRLVQLEARLPTAAR